MSKRKRGTEREREIRWKRMCVGATLDHWIHLFIRWGLRWSVSDTFRRSTTGWI